MNILYVNWNCLGAEDAVEALKELGHTVYGIELSDKSHEQIDWEYVEIIKPYIRNNHIDIVFSFNYFPTISEACQGTDCKYMAWLYDSPYIKVYDKSIVNSCNYVFVFDHMMYEDLKCREINTVYYSPLAVNVKRLSKLNTNIGNKRFESDIAFVGSLYNEEHTLYDRLLEKLKNEYIHGYLEGILEAQINIYGYNFLQDCITEEIYKELYHAMPVELRQGSYANPAYIYSDYFLCRRMAYLERSRVLEILSKSFRVNLYTHNKDVIIGNCQNQGKVNYFTEMPMVFQQSKINLNMTLRSIKSGIPLRAMDIMGAGGFLLTNYQADFLLHFEPDKEFVYYGSVEELMDKATYYLKHDSERDKIARNGKKRIEQEHTYQKRMNEMLHIINR